MKISELHIDGFGHFHDQTVGPFDSPVAILYGTNEAGKSTLLAFMRTVLFGFPDRHRTSHYPPLHGGRHGGRIALVDNVGQRYVIERYEGAKGGPVTVLGENGTQHDASLLTSLCGNATKSIFESVFAFSLTELQTSDILTDSNINSQIYSAGMGAARLPNAIKTLSGRREQIFLQRGSRQLVPKLLAELREVDSKIADCQKDASEYGRLIERRSEIEATLAAIEGDSARLQRHLHENNNLLSAWDPWIVLSGREVRIAELPRIEDFPENGVPRLEAMEDRVRTAASELRDSAERVTDAAKDVGSLIPDTDLLSEGEAISRLRSERSSFEKSVQDLPEREAELHSNEQQFRRRLHELGPDWNEARLRAFDMSIVVRDQINQWQQSVESHDRAVLQAETEHRRALREFGNNMEAEREAQAAFDQVQQPKLDSQAIREQRDAVRTARTRLGDYDRLRQRHEDLRQQQRSAMVPAAPQHLASRQNLVLALILAVLGLAAAGVGVSSGGSLIALAIAIGVLLLSIAGYLLITGRYGQTDTASRVDSLADLIKCAQRDADSARSRLQEASVPLGLDTPDAATLDRAEAGLDDHEKALTAWQSLSDRLRDANAQVERQSRVLEKESQGRIEAQDRLVQVKTDWKEWLIARHMPDTFMPDTVDRFSGLAETALAELHRVEDIRHRVQAIEVDIGQYLELLTPIAARHANPVSPDDTREAISVAGSLISRYDKATRLVEQKTTAERELEQACRAQKRRQESLADASKTLKAFITASGASGTEDFRRLAEIAAEIRDLKRDAELARAALQTISGPGAAYDTLLSALANSDHQQLEFEAETLAEQECQAVNRRDELIKEHANIDAQLRQLGNDEHASALRAQRNELIEQLKDHAREWAKLTIATELLERGRKKFETERQPGVIKHAESFFATVTGGRYHRLYAPIGDRTNTLSVVEPNGATKSPSDLSRGTREQLYLALRFGLIREFGNRSEPLPVIVDEILVNFDPERTKRAAEAFAQLSKTNQVLVFTCHPTMVEAFRGAYPQAQVIDVDSLAARA